MNSRPCLIAIERDPWPCTHDGGGVAPKNAVVVFTYISANIAYMFTDKFSRDFDTTILELGFREEDNGYGYMR